jgi:8-oxo-dGTP diphosphatase
MASSIHVVAGAIVNDAGWVLIAQRPPGKHMAGGWEFPGGKLLPGEAPLAGLLRELKEELNIEVTNAEPVATCVHDYPDRRVLLDLWLVSEYRGAPEPMDAQALKWVAAAELDNANLLPADKPLIIALRRKLGVPGC